MQNEEPSRNRVIITADDFGLNSKTNSDILYLVGLGKIDRVAIMVHGKMTAEEVQQLAKSRVKLDIHLDILHEFENDQRKKLGAIRRTLGFLFKILTGKLTSKKVSTDWENQIEMFIKIFGKSPDGLNSHEHVHLFPPFFKVALNLLDKYSIPYVRFGDSIFILHHKIIAYILHILRKINLKACLGHSCVSSGSLVSLDWIDDLDNFLGNLPEGTTEIVCHPEIPADFEKIKRYL
jgi:chitin disaccharide deacetylase